MDKTRYSIINIIQKNPIPTVEIIWKILEELADLGSERTDFEQVHKDIPPFYTSSSEEKSVCKGDPINIMEFEDKHEEAWAKEGKEANNHFRDAMAKATVYIQLYEGGKSREKLLPS